MPESMQGDFRLGDWLVQPALCRLSSDGRTVQVRAKVMDLLAYLAAHPGEVVSKDRLLDDVWGSRAVSESALTRTVTELRQALGDNADQPRLLETIPKRGYRLIGSVAPVDPALDTALAQTPRAPIGRRAMLIVGAVIVALLIGGATWLRRGGNPSPSFVRVAVLPFDNLGSNADREYLADGLTEDTVVSLGMIDPDHLNVIDGTRYKRTAKSLAEIGRELRADYVLESAVRTEGDRLRLTSKLIRVNDQVQVWSDSFERELTGVLGLQLELSRAVAEQVRFRLSPERLARLARRQTRNGVAYDLYLRGLFHWNQRTPSSTRQAIDYYKRATAFDGGYALAWSGIADAYSASPINGDAEPLKIRTLARHATSEAVRADANLAEVQTSVGILNFWLEWDWPAAEAALRRAISLDSSYPQAHLTLATVLSHTGRHLEAQLEVRRARELDPLDPMMHAISSQIAFNAREFSNAIDHARHALDVAPGFWIGYMQLGQAQEQMGNMESALEAWSTAWRLSGDGNSKALSTRGYALGRAGRVDEARQVLNTVTALSRDRYVPPYAIALVHAGLNEREAVFDALSRAFDAHDVHLAFLPVDPKWDSYRDDARFKKLLPQSGFLHKSVSTSPVQ